MLVVPWSSGVVLVVYSYRRMRTGACVHLHTVEGGGGRPGLVRKGAMKEKENEQSKKVGGKLKAKSLAGAG